MPQANFWLLASTIEAGQFFSIISVISIISTRQTSCAAVNEALKTSRALHSRESWCYLEIEKAAPSKKSTFLTNAPKRASMATGEERCTSSMSQRSRGTGRGASFSGRPAAGVGSTAAIAVMPTAGCDQPSSYTWQCTPDSDPECDSEPSRHRLRCIASWQADYWRGEHSRIAETPSAAPDEPS